MGYKQLTSIPVDEGGTGATSLTSNSLLLGNGTSAISALGAATNGQIPIGSTGTTPVLAALMSATNAGTLITNGAGSIALGNAAILSTSITVTGDGTYTLAGAGSGNLLQGTFYITWSGPNRQSVIAVHLTASNNLGITPIFMNTLYNSHFNGPSLTNLRLLETSNIPFLNIDLGDRNGGTDPIVVTWVGAPGNGNGVGYAPNLAPSSPQGTNPVGYTGWDISGATYTLNGNLGLALGYKLNIGTGSNAIMGTATLVAGTVTVNTSAVTANSIIFLTRNTPGGTVGDLSAPAASITPATSFVINSALGTDTSTVNWWIVN